MSIDDVEISDDGLRASIRLDGEAVDADELIARLKSAGVVEGFDYGALRGAGDGAVVVARGVAPTPPLADAPIEDLLDRLVEPGAVVARLGVASPARPGRTVRGAPIHATNGSASPLRTGAHVERDEKAGVCRARVGGYPFLEGTRLDVRPALEISDDEMEAAMTLRAEAGLSVEAIRADLNKAGVVFGIRPDWIELLIRRAVESGRPERAVVARGQPPRTGRSETLRLRFPIGEGAGARRVLVLPGEALADISLPERGDPGRTVRGREIEGRVGSSIPIRADETVAVSEDGTRLESRVAGYPYFARGGIAVFPFVQVSEDELAATATLHPWPESRPTTRERLLEALDAAGLRYGVDEAAVRELVARVGADGHPAAACVARGTPPAAGEDARVEACVMRELTAGEHRGDDGMNFRSRQVIPIVHAGERVVSRTPPVPGRDGKTVMGRLMPAPAPADIPLAPGDHVAMSDDGREFTSAIDGLLTIEGGRVSIVETLAVDGDVDYACGNIDCEIGVAIRGTVRSMFHVRARGPIRVGETVEDAVVESTASIEVAGGIIQGAHGRVEARGSVRAGFAEHATIRAAGDVELGREALGSTILAVGEIRVAGPIVGGVTAAGRRIVVRSAGSEMSVETVLRVGVDFRALERLQQDFESMQAQVTRIRSTMGESIDALIDTEPSDPRVAAVLAGYRDLVARRDRLVEERTRLLAGTGCATDGPAEIVVEEQLFPNVRLIVRDRVLRVTEAMAGGVFRIDPATGKIAAA